MPGRPGSETTSPNLEDKKIIRKKRRTLSNFNVKPHSFGVGLSPVWSPDQNTKKQVVFSVIPKDLVKTSGFMSEVGEKSLSKRKSINELKEE